MSGPTKIEWTERTWNPVRGCTRVSEGCRNCYAEGIAARFSGAGMPYEGLAEMRDGKARWTGKLAFSETALLEPLRRRKPTVYFVNSMSDIFHEQMPDEWIDRVFAVMALCPQHTFQVLTKRPDRMRAYLSASHDVTRRMVRHLVEFGTPKQNAGLPAVWPLPNVWLGTSCEDQPTADARMPDLIATPAAIHFVSAEPLLAPIDFTRIACPTGCRPPDYCNRCYPDGGPPTGTFDVLGNGKIDWIIVGGESGPNARPMHPAWARAIRDQCAAAEVAFHFKQRGAWSWLQSSEGGSPTDADGYLRLNEDGTRGPNGWPMQRVGKTFAGRLLDGVEHNAMPEVRHG